MTKKASDAAIQKACDLTNEMYDPPCAWSVSEYDKSLIFQRFAHVLQAISDDIESGADMSKWVLPKPVDPILLRARELLAAEWDECCAPSTSRVVRRGDYDDTPDIRAIIKALTEQETSRGE